MKKIIIVIILLMVLTGCTKEPIEYAGSEYIPYEQIDFAGISINETDPDYIFLKNAEFFADRGVSYDGHTPDEIYAWRRLFEKDNALDYFYKLESEANNEGKLYALCGLYYLDYHNYPYLMEKYRLTDETVTYFSGCIWSENYSIRELIKSDEKSAVRLNDNKDTIWAWLERNGTGSFCMDFYGGSIPASVKELSE